MADFLTALRARAHADAEPLRANALTVDRDPTAVHDTFDRHPHLKAYMGLPPEYADDPVVIDGTPVHFTTCVEQVVAMEELARADAGGVLGLPGPSMSGFVIAELADADQRDRYYGMLAARPTWTFFGMTEPGHGSDPAGMGTRLTPDGGGYALTGTKRYVGNGARAGIGVVFARRAPGPLGVDAVLVETDRPGFTAVPIETLGLRGLQLSELRMREVPVGSGTCSAGTCPPLGAA
ncbi:acyl-CoA dehydrogenase family protein [Actinokineospora soli]|uniref:Acyl-CoA dehydrogenase family protein n=1 Tax=Actinokineospora soli TaxID=1048753 RepID=A0ABW2TPN1_9PSEU